MNNLDRIVHFCENMTDCRRAQQLDYFGEYFTREQCLQNRASACDNCLRIAEYKTINATDICKMIVSAVQDLSSGRNRFTILHMVEVFKGASIKKVVDNGHNNTRYHGHLKEWDRSDIQRIFHKLVMDGQLREEIIFANDIPQAYVRTGPNCAQLMAPGSRPVIEFAVMEKSAKAKKMVVATTDDRNTQESEMQEQVDACYRDLIEVANRFAPDGRIAQIMNMEAIKQMANEMPMSKDEMLRIQHVTNANYDKYGKDFLDVTKQYAARREMMLLDMEKQEQQNAANNLDYLTGSDNEGSNVDWDQVGRQAANTSQRGGRKRKPTGGWGGAPKRFRAKRRTPMKKRGGASARGGRAAPKGGGRLMPIPKGSSI